MWFQSCLLWVSWTGPPPSQRRCWCWPFWTLCPDYLGQFYFCQKHPFKKNCRGYLVTSFLHSVLCFLHVTIQCCPLRHHSLLRAGTQVFWSPEKTALQCNSQYSSIKFQWWWSGVRWRANLFQGSYVIRNITLTIKISRMGKNPLRQRNRNVR